VGEHRTYFHSYCNKLYVLRVRASICFLQAEVVQMFPDGVRSQEVGLVGVAVPVDVDLTIPSQHRELHDTKALKFSECGVGSSARATMQLTNRSEDLPVTFQFRRIAHFACQPARGCLQPGHSTDIVVTFSPRQMGLSRYL